LSVAAHGSRPIAVTLPGDEQSWPAAVKVDGAPAAIGQADGRPMVQIAPGTHEIIGRFDWNELPGQIAVPPAIALLAVRLEGRDVNARPDDQGRLVLLPGEHQTTQPETLDVRTFRLIEDDVPLTVTSHYEIAVSGRAREIVLPHALLGGTVPLSVSGALPARLDPEGALRVQVRAGNWSIDVVARASAPLKSIALPAEVASSDEVWSFAAHNELRLLRIADGISVDPRQTAMPEAWRNFPAWRLRPGEALKLVETRRGDADPAPDQLSLHRSIWLDFDGSGYTVSDVV